MEFLRKLNSSEFLLKTKFWLKIVKNRAIFNSESDPKSLPQILFKNDFKMLNSCCVSAFRRAENVHRQIVTGKCHLLGGASRDANSSLGARADNFCHSSHLSIVYCRDSNSCLKLLVSRSKKMFVIFQRGRSRNFKEFIKTTGCSFAVHKWLTQVVPIHHPSCPSF